MQSACLLSLTYVSAENVNSNDCTTDAHFRYTNSQHQKVMMPAADGIGIVLSFFPQLTKDNVSQFLHNGVTSLYVERY
jgi:hypothetical protein